MGLIKTVLKQIFEEGTILEKIKVSDAAYRIRIESESIRSMDFTPGYFLRMAIGLTEDSLTREDFVRSYSVWNIDQVNGTMDVAIATHSQGAGAKWVSQVQPGNKVFFRWKKGKFLLDESADSYLMIGDLSALSHLYILGRNLSESKKVESIIYSEHLTDLYHDIDETNPFNFYEMELNPVEELLAGVNSLVPTMQGEKMAYIAGDSRVCVALNQYFRKELNWKTSHIKTKPFWNPDKKGLE